MSHSHLLLLLIVTIYLNSVMILSPLLILLSISNNSLFIQIIASVLALNNLFDYLSCCNVVVGFLHMRFDSLGRN